MSGKIRMSNFIPDFLKIEIKVAAPLRSEEVGGVRVFGQSFLLFEKLKIGKQGSGSTD